MNSIIDEIQGSNLSELTKLKLLTALGETPSTTLFTVREDESGVPLADFLDFVADDHRPNNDLSHDGYGTIDLSNKRGLFVDAYGIFDRDDLPKTPDGNLNIREGENSQAAYVSWNELLQLLDQCRRARQLGMLN